MTCREFTAFIVDHVEGKLPKRVAEEFDDHLSVCPTCRTYLMNYRHTIVLARESETSDEIPEDVPAELVEAVLAARRRRS